MNPQFPSPHISSLLTQLGLTPNCTGFFQTACALELALQEPRALCLITKWIYPAVAKRCNTSPSAVERNIRLSVSHIWKEAPLRLASLSPKPLHEKPSNAAFLAILCVHLAKPL